MIGLEKTSDLTSQLLDLLTRILAVAVRNGNVGIFHPLKGREHQVTHRAGLRRAVDHVDDLAALGFLLGLGLLGVGAVVELPDWGVSGVRGVLG
jgi:hypothetical protein